MIGYFAIECQADDKALPEKMVRLLDAPADVTLDCDAIADMDMLEAKTARLIPIPYDTRSRLQYRLSEVANGLILERIANDYIVVSQSKTAAREQAHRYAQALRKVAHLVDRYGSCNLDEVRSAMRKERLSTAPLFINTVSALESELRSYFIQEYYDRFVFLNPNNLQQVQEVCTSNYGLIKKEPRTFAIATRYVMEIDS